MWAPEFHSHVTFRVTPDKVGSDVRGEGQRRWENTRAAFPDMVFTVNLVVSNWTVEGGHTGAPFYDEAPSGEPVFINGIAIVGTRGDKIVEHGGCPHCQEGPGLIR